MWARLLLKQVKSYSILVGSYCTKFLNKISNSLYLLALKARSFLINFIVSFTVVSLRLVIIVLVILIIKSHINYILCETSTDSLSGQGTEMSTIMSVFFISAHKQLTVYKINTPHKQLGLIALMAILLLIFLYINPYNPLAYGALQIDSGPLDHNNILIGSACRPYGRGVRITGWKKHSKYPGVIVFRAKNVELLDRDQALESLFKALTKHPKFKALGEFKIIRVNVCTEAGEEWSIHSNTLIKPDTTFQEYYNEVKGKINHFYDQHYTDDTFNTYVVTVMAADHLRQKRISWKITDTHMEVTSIKPLESPKSSSSSIAGGRYG